MGKFYTVRYPAPGKSKGNMGKTFEYYENGEVEGGSFFVRGFRDFLSSNLDQLLLKIMCFF